MSTTHKERVLNASETLEEAVIDAENDDNVEALQAARAKLNNMLLDVDKALYKLGE